MLGQFLPVMRERARSWMFQESQGERREYEANSYIHHQPFPEQVSEEKNVHGDYDGYQQHNERYDV